MVDQPFTEDHIRSLISKLETIDFTDEERAILEAAFNAAAGESEVEAFGMDLGSLQLFSKSTPVTNKASQPTLDAGVTFKYDLKANKEG